METIGYILLTIAAVAYTITMVSSIINIMTLPWEMIVLIIALILGFGILFIKILKERIDNKEDIYYSKNVKR